MASFDAVGQAFAGPASSELGMLGEFFAAGASLAAGEARVAMEVDFVSRFDLGTPVPIPADGYPIEFTWPGVPGATSAEVEAASLGIGPMTTQRSLGELKTEKAGSQYLITTGGKRIYSLRLNGLKVLPEGAEEQVAVSSQGEIPGGFHLVVEIVSPQGGWLPPLHAVPPVPRDHMIPATLTGASFDSGILRLPDVVTSKIRLTYAKGDRPNEFEAQDFSLGTVEGTETVVPKDLKVTAPDGSVAWAFPGDFPPAAPPADVDLRVSLETALTAAVAAGGPVTATFLIEGSGTISLAIRSAHGAILRTTPGVVRTVVAGEDVSLGEDVALPAEVATSATGDLTVRYDGIRLLETVSDATPAPAGSFSGVVVTTTGAVRELPPQALDGRVVRRIALFGRAPVDTDLEVSLVDAVTGAALTPPAALAVAASLEFGTYWFDVPAHDPIGRAAHLSVRATSGRFLWVEGLAANHPIAKIAIDDPAWPGRDVSLGGIPLSVPVGVPESQQPAAALPTAAFTGATPRFHSDLFLTIDVADLVLRYAR